MRAAWEGQVRDPSSPCFGKIPWHLDELWNCSTADPNPVLFALQPAGPVLIRYGGMLNSTFKASIQPALEAAAHFAMHPVGPAAHTWPLNYTN